MEDLIKHITSKSVRSSCIQKIKELNNRSVLLYGSGIYAMELTNFLSSLDIEVSGYIVDESFRKSDQKNHYGHGFAAPSLLR